MNREALLILLNDSKRKRNESIDRRVYGEWSCGQQDADAEYDTSFFELIDMALLTCVDNSYYPNLSDERRIILSEFIDEVISDFAYDINSYLEDS